ncbi:MAG: magnesium chelatase [Flavobacteriaceae bacterium CG2_30_34_30]|nr:MAG: magnesium chelatase [Flavobacteriaceae bacterium CG2_30_34_30]PIQ19018.1 MAG: magnesium chelatase [Flavobacteriaceae bacterium CG18_big_fil_WC_8_21_14_2_50_34_36]PIV49392.1 MAG: magnesium chelatase [Flavobacteriaceae bacterium CG02_land_8_20_14_3_00_34_13]PJC08344.1 MAG: magnesium chelatase [Flavobacteriaceae bacterium CG_4_9_14_0_8_um_filter_34_30]
MEHQQTNNDELHFNTRIPLEELKIAVHAIKEQLSKIIIGQNDFIELLIVNLLANGHVLIEGVPGIAKTITAKLFAKTLKTNFSRIQFTPDLMPSDILGTSVLNMKISEFEFKKGPIFSNIVLIDEINRAPAKTQSALFEVMEERQITMDGTKYEMEYPFMVIATQNPLEQEGTYALPEAQLDRFLFKIKVGYPNLQEEILILKSHHVRKLEIPLDKIKPVLTSANLKTFRSLVQEVLIEDKIFTYIAQIVDKTRNHPHLYLGGSPRASIAIMNASKAFAAIQGRDFVTPEDVKKTLAPVLGHRIILSPEREMEGMTPETVIDSIAQSIEIPR